MRSVVMRAAVSACRVPSTKRSMLGAASQIAAPTVARFSTPIAVRCFSQTFRAAEDGFSPLEAASDSRGQSSRETRPKLPRSTGPLINGPFVWKEVWH